MHHRHACSVLPAQTNLHCRLEVLPSKGSSRKDQLAPALRAASATAPAPSVRLAAAQCCQRLMRSARAPHHDVAGGPRPQQPAQTGRAPDCALAQAQLGTLSQLGDRLQRHVYSALHEVAVHACRVSGSAQQLVRSFTCSRAPSTAMNGWPSKQQGRKVTATLLYRAEQRRAQLSAYLWELSLSSCPCSASATAAQALAPAAAAAAAAAARLQKQAAMQMWRQLRADLHTAAVVGATLPAAASASL